MARAIGGALALGARGSEHVEVDTGVHDVDAVRVFTLAIVCIVCTSGTFQRSLASQPTCPDSQ